MHRNQFLADALIQFRFDQMLDQVQAFAQDSNPSDWRKAADHLNIDPTALDALDRVPVAYPCYFCNPAQLAHSPSLVGYYRNIAMLSAELTQEIGLNTVPYETGIPLPQDKAEEIARYLNGIVSAIVIKIAPLITTQTHVALVMANLGDDTGISWQNRFGS